ncbi:MAG: SoxR reducing system RseC family protein [Desulfosarcina sp.]
MAQTIGWVVEIKDGDRATVVAENSQASGGCGAACQCRDRRPAGPGLPAINQAGAVAGDRVMLTIASQTLLARMAVLYLVPVLGMLVGAFTGAALSGGIAGSGGGQSAIFGLAGFLLGFAVSIAISRIWSAARPVVAVITRVVATRLDITPCQPSAGCGSTGK